MTEDTGLHPGLWQALFSDPPAALEYRRSGLGWGTIGGILGGIVGGDVLPLLLSELPGNRRHNGIGPGAGGVVEQLLIEIECHLAGKARKGAAAVADPIEAMAGKARRHGGVFTAYHDGAAGLRVRRAKGNRRGGE